MRWWTTLCMSATSDLFRLCSNFPQFRSFTIFIVLSGFFVVMRLVQDKSCCVLLDRLPVLISLRLGFRRNFLSVGFRRNFLSVRTDRKFLRNPNLNEIMPVWVCIHKTSKVVKTLNYLTETTIVISIAIIDSSNLVQKRES